MAKYYHSKESVDEYIQMAKGHDGRLIIPKLKDYLPAGSHVLEIGSGPGTDWKILNEDYLVVGSDFSMEFLKHLRAALPEGEFLQLDAETLETDLRFDGIYSNKVLHHLEDEALQNSVLSQYEILNAEGIIFHTFWHGQDTEIYNELFVNYHTDQDIINLFGNHFECLLISYYKEFEKGDSFLYIGKKKKGQAL